MIKIAAVVVLYNPKQKNIDNINKYIDSVDKLYVIDNSEDEIIRLTSDKKIEYIKLNENKGLAYALNLGAKKAIEDKYKYLLTLDQDSNMTSKNVDKMIEFLDSTKIDKIGLISPYHDIGFDEEGKKGEVEERLEVMTSGNIIDLDAYSIIGGFKDWLFIDCVDYDYCLNLNKNGFKVLRLNDVIMKHSLGDLVVHKLFGKEYPCFNHNPIRRYYIVRNTYYINQMYKDLYPDYCAHLIRVQKGQVKRIIAFEKNKIKKLKMMHKGYKDFKKGIKGKLK